MTKVKGGWPMRKAGFQAGQGGVGLVMVVLALSLACGGRGGGGSVYSLATPYQAPSTAHVLSFSPLSGPVATRVQVSGWGLKGATQVTFGGVPSTVVKADSDYLIYAAVPSGAVSGPLVVATPGGDGTTSQSFKVEPGPPAPPLIIGFRPTVGAEGTPVTILGAGFFSAASVAFGGVPVTLQPPSDDSQLVVTVPAGAKSGPITVTLPQGVASISSRSFTVTAQGTTHPVITDFTPKTGLPGTRIEMTGVNLATVNSLTIGGQSASFYVWDDQKVVGWVPFVGAVSGPLVLTGAAGSATHPVPFILESSAPTLTGLFPLRGKVGSVLELTGTNLFGISRIDFGSVRAFNLRLISDQLLRVVVPAGATSGPITVTGPQGQATSLDLFTVTEDDTPLAVKFSGLYITQATQRLDASVPLVANRDGLLRIFLEGDQGNTLVPAVAVTLTDAQGRTVWTSEVLATGSGVPTIIREGDLDASWNVRIPGSFLQPGAAILARLLPNSGLASAGLTWPSNGKPLPLDIRTVPPLGLTVLPIVTPDGAVGRVSDATRTLASWGDRLKAIYPLDEVDLQQGAPFNTTLSLGSDLTIYLQLRNDLEAARLALDPASRRYYYGVYKRSLLSGVLGLGAFPASARSNAARTAVGCDDSGRRDGENYPEVLAHEVGHLLNRRHAPCGSAAGPDLDYPYAKGSLGAFGLEVAANTVFDPTAFTDVMGYCSPQWISDYTYKGVLDWRALQAQAGVAQVSEAASLASAANAAQPGLLVWGYIKDGAVTLEPAFDVPACTSQPEPGAYSLVCLDAAGQVLADVPFAAELGPDLPPEVDMRTFAFAIPLTPAMQAAMASLQIRRNGVVLASRTASAGASGVSQAANRPGASGASQASAALGREPVATAWGEGRVLLTWDASVHPKILVKDVATGQPLALAEGGAMTLVTTARALDLVCSDGLRATTCRVLVRE